MEHLLGFIRDGVKMVPVTVATPEFFDVTRNSSCTAVLVPLALLKVDGWTLTADAAYLPRSVSEVIEGGRSFVTSRDTATEFSVLMYPRSDNPETSRGGVLLKRSGASLQPILATIDGSEYLLELKGCGCPIGGFGGYHLRRTTPKGCHFHLAGALGFPGAVAEFEGLEARRAAASATGAPLEMRAVGVCRYSHPAALAGEPLGQVLRLCPSSLRASFSRNEALDKILAVDDRVVSWTLGRESASLLECADPRLHRNPSLNNLCYVASDCYVLTDLEACPPLSMGYEALDFEDSVVPDQYRHGARSSSYFPEIVAGMRTAPGRIGDLVAAHQVNSEPELTQLVYEHDVAQRIFSLRFAGTSSPVTVLERNFDYLQVFMPEAYFKLSWADWLSQHFIPLFEEKAAILDMYRAFAFDGNWLAVRSRIEREIECPRSDKKSHSTTLEALKGRAAAAQRRLREWCRIGAFVPDRTIETLFVEVPDDESRWFTNRRAISEVISLAHIASGGPARMGPAPRGGPATATSAWRPWDVVHPFFEFVQTYLCNESRVLKAVQSQSHLLHPSALEAVDASVGSLQALRTTLEREPERFHDLIRSGRQAFVRALKLPYMGAALSDAPERLSERRSV